MPRFWIEYKYLNEREPASQGETGSVAAGAWLICYLTLLTTAVALTAFGRL